MRKLSGYGPSIIVLITAGLVLFAGPAAVRRLTYEHTRTQIIQARHGLESTDVLERIIRLKLDRIARRVGVNHKATFDYDARLVDAVLARCTEVDTGARNVDHILNGTLLPQIAEEVLARMAEGNPVARIKVGAAKNGDFRYAVA